jgi:type VI secretion system protein VasJ
MDDYLLKLLERAKTPISEDKPCGDNAREDDRYDKTKTEIMKMTAGGAVIDWKGLRLSADALLSERTKDLTLAAYLSLALLKEYEYPGLMVGLQIIDSFLDTWWEPMFPPAARIKARVQIFEWMDERLSALIGITEPKVAHADELRRCQEICNTLPDKIQSLAKTQVTGFSRLRTEINQWVSKLPAPAPPPPPPPPKEEPKPTDAASEKSEMKQDESTGDAASSTEVSASPTAPAAQAPKASGVKVEMPAAVEDIESLDQGIKAMIQIVHLLRKVDPLSPLAYRLSRILKWDNLTGPPPAGADGKTKIPPPSQQNLTMLEAQLSAANWPLLTQTAEHLFITQGTFFLDLQRYVFQGLLNQGAEETAKVVMFETGRMLNRFPVATNLSYLTGLSFANDETRAWARDAQKAALGPGGGGEEEDNEWLSEAMKTAAKSMAAALPKLQEAISHAENVKKVMKRQRDVAKFFASNREYQWAMPLLESLNEKIETIGLAEWDPEFCSDVWELMLRGHDAMPGWAEATGKDNLYIVKIRQKLFETDIAKAAALTPKEKKK